VKLQRASGILLHPTSLPGADGIGDLGPQAYAWVDFLARSGCKLWQVLPLGPTGYGDSPYQCFSAFAGNPYLVSAALLMDLGLLKRKDLSDRPEFPVDRVDFGPVIEWKLTLVNRAYARFKVSTDSKLREDYQTFCHQEADWLNDFSLFMALKEAHAGAPWDQWEKEYRLRDERSLAEFREKNEEVLDQHKFRQFIFFTQWNALHAYANSRGIKIIGDAPIFVSFDSADAWSHPDLFFLDEDRKPTVVAGVPPDYFSPTGQLWGNPLYKWPAHKETGYQWWIKRLQSTLKTVDLVRLDHFRGFAGYWEVPAGMPTAEVGKWVPGPGMPFFKALQKAIPDLPIIAEDLGEITPDVIALRDGMELPGMKILQFAFSADAKDPFLPHNYPVNCVAYSGTHDNDTVIGWYKTATEKEKDFYRRYMARSGEDPAGDMVRGVWSSVAAFAICPLQDLLRLGTEARMNFPGKPAGNWTWRMKPGTLSVQLRKYLVELNTLYLR
jgi:4-alpha-glucanotransferase